MEQPKFSQLNLIVRDMAATVSFYQDLGLAVDAAPEDFHVAVELGDMRIEFDTSTFAPTWDTGWRGNTGGATVIGFAVATRQAVDDTYARLTFAGHHGRQPPYDAFFGARYTIVDDPDGNGIGLMSPIEGDRKFWPPNEPPRASD